jgi:hypothetical protein
MPLKYDDHINSPLFFQASLCSYYFRDHLIGKEKFITPQQNTLRMTGSRVTPRIPPLGGTMFYKKSC